MIKHPAAIARAQESISATCAVEGERSALAPAHQVPRTEAHHFNYELGHRKHVKPLKGPRKLLVQGRGGDIKVDLSGIGVELHRDSFAFRMPDDSMHGLNIRQGEIALIEPCLWALCEGDIVLVSINGVETLRRVTSCGKLMYLQADDNSGLPLLPAWDHALSGMATAFLRVADRREIVRHPVEETPRTGKREGGPSRPKLTLGPTSLHASNSLSDDPPGPWGSGHVRD